MAISETARRTHDELFRGHVSTRAVTDPELIEVFDNFAFDEVLRASRLAPPTQLLLQLAAMIAADAIAEYRVMLGAALTVGVTPVEVKEVVYQAVAYVGMARVFAFLHATNEVLAARGIALPLPAQATTTPETRFETGLAVQARIAKAEGVAAMRANAAPDAARFNDFLADNCFGDDVSRDCFLRARLAAFEAQADLAASTDFPAGE